ncbi:MAG TPA: MBL fold metallo-hydrolase [Chitinophagales bacterium]|nr:MBL fold metallo-hydrolase [Chitinophagales bacterium]
MKISYICHACIYVETSDAKIVCDPWWDGPAYQNQWHVFPKPVNQHVTEQADFILISHGHEDHLHARTLEHLNKSAQVFFPYQWKDGAKEFLNDLGFSQVTEAVSFKTFQITPETKITYIANNLDAMVVIENNGEVLVNLNDALNAHHKSVLRLFIDEIKNKWKKIDYLFCGLGGAGYFPNTVHHESKDDAEVGKLREQFLAHNFCKLVNGLQPKRVIPFLPGFALLADDKRWINTIKFPREKLNGYFREYFDPESSIEWMNLFPGDWIDNGEVEHSSPYHDLAINGDISHLVEEVYAHEIKTYNTISVIDEDDCLTLLKRISDNIPHAARVFHQEALEHLSFSIKILNAEGKNILNVRYIKPHWKFEISASISEECHLLIRTQSHILDYSLESPWGGDVLMVGYGADIDVLNEIALKENHDIICLRLLTRIPVATDYLRKQPLRMMKFMITNPLNTSLSIKQKLIASGNPNKIPYNERNHWINKTPCDICRACNMPLLTYEFGEMLEQEEYEIATRW